MEVRGPLVSKFFASAYMQRWNDKLRPIDLYELDKQAHKMVIAYFIGKFEEKNAEFSWIELIEGGMFEFLQRIVLTDIKPPVFYLIKKDIKKYRELNKWVYEELEPVIAPLGREFREKFINYFANEDETINKRVLAAAHFSATSWEFEILYRANPRGFEMEKIRRELTEKQEHYSDLAGMRQLNRYRKYKHFINLCGELRFQTRWSNLHRIPRTSVMGHSLLVAVLSYLFSWQVGACSKRRINNYFTGLFHDFPEVLTRDIVSPVKGAVSGLRSLIKNIEKDLMESEVYNLLPSEWRNELELYTESEFSDVIILDKKRKNVKSEEIFTKYNDDRYCPRDGTLVKLADDLVAFIEAHEALKNGCAHEEFEEAKTELRNQYRNFKIASLDVGKIYADFD